MVCVLGHCWCWPRDSILHVRPAEASHACCMCGYGFWFQSARLYYTCQDWRTFTTNRIIIRSRSFGVISQSAVVKDFPITFVSTAKFDKRYFSAGSKSLMYEVKRMGPALPRAVLRVTGSYSGSYSLCITHCFLPVNQSWSTLSGCHRCQYAVVFQGVVRVVPHQRLFKYTTSLEIIMIIPELQ